MDGRELAASLDQVREVVRATGIEPLRGVRAPVTGLLELRGQPLPVVDLRSAAEPGALGDVLVLIDGVTDGTRGSVGLAVDKVLAVVDPEALTGTAEPPSSALPGYVLEVLRTADDEQRAVFLVDLYALAGLGAEVRAQT
jgi:chemotaxis signal transduction protein